MITEESILRDICRLIVWYPVRWMVRLLPLETSLFLFRLMGVLHYRLGRKKEILHRNMISALGGNGIQGHIRRYFENHYVNQLIIFLLPKLNRRNIDRCHRFRGMEIIEREMKKGKGCILLHGHFGPTHLPLIDLGLKGYRVGQIGFLRQPRGLSNLGKAISFRLRDRCEGKIPAEIVQVGTFLRPAFQRLEEGGLLMMAGDGAGGGDLVGKFAPFSFLGGRMLFPMGVESLSRRTGASIVPIFTLREGLGYLTVVEKPIGSEEVTAEFVKILEGYVLRYPGQWHFWDEFSPGMLLL